MMMAERLQLKRYGANVLWVLLRQNTLKGFKKIRAQGLLMHEIRLQCTDKPDSDQLAFKDGNLELTERQAEIVDEVIHRTADSCSGEMAVGLKDLIEAFYTPEELKEIEDEEKSEKVPAGK